MLEYTYHIVMQTPLGEKKGTVHLNINIDRVSGRLNILGKENVFTGEIDIDGKCNLNGSIKTIVSTFEYTAEGYIHKESINLTLYGRKDVFYVSGTALKNLKEGDWYA